jgi:hypothetical protein
VDDVVASYVYNDMPNYMDDDVAAYMDDDVAVDVEMMMSTAHTQFRIGPKLGQLFH